jgi:hypothetical protein
LARTKKTLHFIFGKKNDFNVHSIPAFS